MTTYSHTLATCGNAQCNGNYVEKEAFFTPTHGLQIQLFLPVWKKNLALGCCYCEKIS
ncbi:unnamed protein product, partial [Ceratitis capitata]